MTRKITQPRRPRAAFDAGEPVAKREEKQHHAEPHSVDHPQTVAVIRRRGAFGRCPVHPVGPLVAGVGQADGHVFDHEPVQEIEEERYAAEDDEEPAQAARAAVDKAEEDERRPQRHEQKRKRRRVFLAVHKREGGEEPVLLHRPGSRLAGPSADLVAIEIAVAQGHEDQDERQAQAKKLLAPAPGVQEHERAQAVAGGQHTDPGNEWIERQELPVGKRLQHLPRVQDAPQPAILAPVGRVDAIEQIVEENERQAEHRDRGDRQEDQPGQKDHRPADGPDDLAEGEQVVDVQEPAETDDRQLQEDQPHAATQKKPGQLPLAPAAGTVEKRSGARQKHKDRGTEMGDPARQEVGRRRLGQVERLERQARNVAFDMIERHEHDHNAAQKVDRVEARPAQGLGGRNLDDAPFRSCVQGKLRHANLFSDQAKRRAVILNDEFGGREKKCAAGRKRGEEKLSGTFLTPFPLLRGRSWATAFGKGDRGKVVDCVEVNGRKVFNCHESDS